MKYTTDTKKIADNIRAERSRVKLKQEEVAEKIGLSRATYLEYEKDAATLRLEYLLKLADLFGCDLDAFYLP